MIHLKVKLVPFVLLFLLLPVFSEPFELILQTGQTAWASSELSETLGGKPVVYEVGNLFDDDTTSCWVEAAKGPGVEEYIAFEVQEAVDSLEIVNGFAASPDLFGKNARVRTFRLVPFLAVTAPGLVTETDAVLYFVYEAPEPVIIPLKDTREAQTIGLPLTAEEQEDFIVASIESFLEDYPVFAGFLRGEYAREYGDDEGFFPEFIRMNYALYCFKLVIEDVYPGSRYSDTCVSEIRVLF